MLRFDWQALEATGAAIGALATTGATFADFPRSVTRTSLSS